MSAFYSFIYCARGVFCLTVLPYSGSKTLEKISFLSLNMSIKQEFQGYLLETPLVRNSLM